MYNRAKYLKNVIRSVTLPSLSFFAENTTICKPVIACRCGLKSRRTDTASYRLYRSVKRCKCAKSEAACTDLCNCHGNCGGKVCGGAPKSTKGRQGRKRSPHILQKIKTPRRSKSYLVSKNEVLNPGKLNMLEYVVVCAIILFLESSTGSNGKVTSTDVKNCYDEIMKLLKSHDIPLPLTSRSLKELGSGIKKICAIRKNVK